MRPKTLGGQHHLLPAATALGEPAPDDVLGDALAGLPAVHVGGVEKIDPQFERLVHDGKRIGFTGLRTKVHGAQA
jgi:hypothetical protein